MCHTIGDNDIWNNDFSFIDEDSAVKDCDCEVCALQTGYGCVGELGGEEDVASDDMVCEDVGECFRAEALVASAQRLECFV